MFGQLKQAIFLAGFGLICCIFIFFVPFGSEKSVTSEAQSWNLSLLSETGDIQEQQQRQIFSWILQIWVDARYWDVDFGLLAEEFSKRFWLPVQFQLMQMKDLVASDKDIFLVAYDDVEGLSWWTMHFSEAIDNYFVQWSPVVLGSGSFIPYAFDPLVWFIKPGSANTLAELYQQVNLQTGSVFFFPFFEGTGTINQNLSFAQMIRDFVVYNDNGAFQNWLEMYRAAQEAPLRLLKKVGKNQICSSSPLLCLVDTWIVSVWFWFFSEGRNFPQLKQIAYPYWYEAASVRMYGFVLNPESQNRSLAEAFLTMYLQMDPLKLRSLLDAQGRYSAFWDVFNQQCQEKQTCQSLYPIRVLERSEEKVQKILKDALFSKVLEKKMKPDLYLERVSL